MSGETPLISIITPTHNRRAYLEQAVSSVQDQITQGKFLIEHIIVDDYSTDDTRKFLGSLNYPNLKAVFLDSRHGQVKTRRVAVENSKGKYIFPLDSDDLLVNSGLEVLFDSLKDGKHEWAYGDCSSIDSHGQILPGQDYHGWAFNSARELRDSMFSGEHIFLPTVLFSRKVYDLVGGYNEKLEQHENQELYFKFALNNFLPEYCPEKIIKRRIHKGNLSKKSINKPGKQKNKLRRIFLDLLSQLPNN